MTEPVWPGNGLFGAERGLKSTEYDGRSSGMLKLKLEKPKPVVQLSGVARMETRSESTKPTVNAPFVMPAERITS